MTLVPGSSSRPPPASSRPPSSSRPPGRSDCYLPRPPRIPFAPVRALREQLLQLVLDAPLDDGLPAVARFLVRQLSDILPDVGVGICLRVGDDLDAEARPTPLPWIEAARPVSIQDEASGGAFRLFASFEHETVLCLDEQGSTLHLAHRSPAGPFPVELGASDQQQALSQLALRAAGRCLSLARQDSLLSTQRAQLRQQMARANQLDALARITGSVAHELNNPLTSILAYTEYLERLARERLARGEPVEDELERLARITQSAERISRFSEALLNHARPATEISARVSLLEVVEKALDFCDHELERHGVVLERRFEATTPFVRGIAGQLVQIFVNLVTNAIHAAAEGGRQIVVHAQHSEGWGVVSISDNGAGIPAQHIERIFEPFFTTKPAGLGTGLGLSIVHELITRHGGLVSVESTPGVGTTFRVSLPTA